MAKIGIDARELRTSSGRYVERLLHYLQQIDNEHDYVVLLKPQDMDGWRPQNPRFSKVACPHKEFTFDEQLGLKKQVDSLQLDLMHFAFTQQPVRYTGKVVTTIHDLTTVRFTNPGKNPLVFKLKQQVYKWVIRQAARKSVRVITPSQYVRDDVAQFTGVSPDKITVTYESADKITDAPQPFTAVEGKRFIMYLGRPTPHKNLERLIAAFQILQAQQPDLYLVLAGKKDSNYRRIETLTKTKQIANIMFTDFISEGQLRWLYEHAAAYVFPSLSEGFGLPGLEAMQYNVPVIASNATCLPEIYGDAALYFNPLDVQDMADKIATILHEPEQAKQLAAKGNAQVQKYSWHRMAEQTIAIYEQALES